MKPLCIVTILTLLPLAANAQSSADDLIGKLKLQPGHTTRGIHALSTSAPSEEPAPAVLQPAPAHKPTAGSVVTNARPPANAAPEGEANLVVQFEFGSDRLTPAATKTLDTLGQALTSSELATDKFEIIGHTDTVGRPETNQQLSERRAQAVVAYITEHYHVDPSRLTALGKGQSEPLVPTSAGVAEPRNRRVQVINMGV